jgi:uncharacterized protein
MPHYSGPLLTEDLLDRLAAAQEGGQASLRLSLDLGRSDTEVTVDGAGFVHAGRHYPWPSALKDRTIYLFSGGEWLPLQRYAGSLIKLVPTDWGTPTFEIDGIKMLVSARLSPWEDARRKVALVQPRGKRVLDCCGGLGYFAARCLAEGAAHILSFEKNPDVLWLREHNPWSPDPASAEAGGRLQLVQGDVAKEIVALPTDSVDAVLHDPPRFGIAGELYALDFYQQLARVLRPGGRLFHYTGAPNRKTSGRDVPKEVAARLGRAGFDTELALDGVVGVKRRRGAERQPGRR